MNGGYGDITFFTEMKWLRGGKWWNQIKNNARTWQWNLETLLAFIVELTAQGKTKWSIKCFKL